MSVWSEGVKGYPCGAIITSLVADGWFVDIGSRGRIVGRSFPNYPVMDELLIEVLWLDTDTKTTVPCETVQRVDMESAA